MSQFCVTYEDETHKLAQYGYLLPWLLTQHTPLFRCHVCGFETEGRALFHNHMTEHHQREHGSFSLHCCLCDHSTNQEAAMRAHADTHIHGDTGANGEMRWVQCLCAVPVNPVSGTPVWVHLDPAAGQLHQTSFRRSVCPSLVNTIVRTQG